MNETLITQSNVPENNNLDPIVEAINQVKGPLIEIGGPTPDDWVAGRPYRIIDTELLTKKLMAINIAEGVAVWEISEEDNDDDNDGYVQTDFLPADIRADGTQLPFRAGSIGSVFASALPIAIRPQVIAEAIRVLEPGGYVVWQDGTGDDLHTFEDVGFLLIKHQPTRVEGHDYIFRKPELAHSSHTTA